MTKDTVIYYYAENEEGVQVDGFCFAQEVLSLLLNRYNLDEGWVVTFEKDPR